MLDGSRPMFISISSKILQLYREKRNAIAFLSVCLFACLCRSITV